MADTIARPQKSIYQGGKVGKIMMYIAKPAAIRMFAYVEKILPEPTKENTWHPNSHKLIDIRDWFMENNQYFKPDSLHGRACRGFFNLAIAVYDFDHAYRDMGNAVAWKMIHSDWAILSGEKEPRQPWWKDYGFKFG